MSYLSLQNVWIQMLSIFLLFTVGCSGGGGGDSGDSAATGDQVAANEQPADSSGSTSETGDDDLEVAENVPMALASGDFLNAFNDAMSSRSSGGYSTSTTKTQTGDSPTQQFTIDLLTYPTLALGELHDLSGALQDMFDALFGTTGLFKGEDVAIAQGTTSKKFNLDGESGIDYAEISYNPNADRDTGYRYKVQLYILNSTTGVLDNTTTLEFSRITGQLNKERLRVTHRQLISTGETQHLIVSLDESTNELDAEFGLVPVRTDRPAKTVMNMLLDTSETEEQVVIRGAYIWDEQTPITDGLVPRTMNLNDGDIEVFGMSDKGAYSAQEVAFIQTDDVETVDFSTGATTLLASDLFTNDDYSYAKRMEDFVVELISTASVNTGCATTGSTIQATYSANSITMPSAVSSAPANICSSNTSMTDDQRWALIEATCANFDIELSVTLSDNSTVDYPVCDRVYEAQISENVQYFTKSGGTKSLVTDSSAVTDDHLAQKVILQGSSAFDFSGLMEENMTWPALITAAESAFTNAELKTSTTLREK